MRAAADKLEAADIPNGGEYYPRLNVHWIDNREFLRAIASVAENVIQENDGSVHWFNGEISGTKLTAFFEGHLLGEVKREKEVVREYCEQTIADLLAESSEPATA